MATTRSSLSDIEVLQLAQIKAEAGRDLDDSVDENTLVSGETGAGTFGVFKFFTGIRRFFKGLTALGTLADTGRIPTHDADGNVSYVTPQQILDCVSTVNGNKSFTNDVSVSGALNIMGVNLDDKINWAVGDKQQVISYAVGSGDISSFDIGTLHEGVYLVSLTGLYSGWDLFYVGILCKYGSSVRLVPLSSMNITVGLNGTVINTSAILSGAKFLPIGYW